MELGPFNLGEANESNKYGHFEAQPFVLLNRELQLREFGFEGDLPDSDDVLRSYCQRDGRWTSDDTISDAEIARGRELLDRLTESSPVCGFKDPRTAQVWPYWRRVFASMSNLRIVPLFLVRSPHEIAMSVFRRSLGRRDYAQALDVTAVHFRRMQEVRAQWPGGSAIVQFDPRVCRGQLQRAAKLCSLTWSDDVFAEVYDASCRHHEAAIVDHPAQAAFEAFVGQPAQPRSMENDRQLQADAAAREATLRHYRELHLSERDSARWDRDVAHAKIGDLWNYIAALKADSAALRVIEATIPPLKARLEEATCELNLIHSSKTWRVREALAHALGLGRQGTAHQDRSSKPRFDGQEAMSPATGLHYDERKDCAGT
jgi:hypothetical protein